jgi:hypothetical protein
MSIMPAGSGTEKRKPDTDGRKSTDGLVSSECCPHTSGTNDANASSCGPRAVSPRFSHAMPVRNATRLPRALVRHMCMCMAGVQPSASNPDERCNETRLERETVVSYAN